MDKDGSVSFFYICYSFTHKKQILIKDFKNIVFEEMQIAFQTKDKNDVATHMSSYNMRHTYTNRQLHDRLAFMGAAEKRPVFLRFVLQYVIIT